MLYLKSVIAVHNEVLFVSPSTASRGSSSVTSDGGIPEVPNHRDSEPSEVFDDDVDTATAASQSREDDGTAPARGSESSDNNSDSLIVIHTSEDGVEVADIQSHPGAAREANGSPVGAEAESEERREERAIQSSPELPPSTSLLPSAEPSSRPQP